MSLMTKIQEALAANPGVGWYDLVLRRLRTATGSTDGGVNDLWMRWLASQGYTQGSLNDRMVAYWRANNTPLAERNAFYFGYTAFFGIAPPDAPTAVVASPLDAAASVAFVAPVNVGGGPITDFRVKSTPGGIEANGASSPIVVPGLTNGLSYSFTVRAQNAGGFGPESAASNSIIPTAVVAVLTNRSNNFPTATQTWSGYRFERAGTIIPDSSGGVGTRINTEWVSVGRSATVGDGYEIRAIIVSGTVNGTTSAFNTWLSLNSDRTFALTTAGSFLVEIRPVGGSVVVSAIYTIIAI